MSRIEVIDDEDDDNKDVINHDTTCEPRVSPTTHTLAMPNVSRASPASRTCVSRETKPNPDIKDWHVRPTVEIFSADDEEEDDIEVIDSIGPSRSVSRLQTQRSREGTLDSLLPSDLSENLSSAAIDLEMIPDVRSRSPIRTNGSHAAAGTALEPIDVDAYESSHLSVAPRVQHVNGAPVGVFHQGRYVPYRARVGHQSDRPYSPPLATPSHLSGETPAIYDLYKRLSSGSQLLNHRSFSAMAGAKRSADLLLDAGSESRKRRHQLDEEALEQLLATISDREIPIENRIADPAGLSKALMPHQRIGLTWMIAAEAGTNKGGILADAMGLGKTIQSIALMLAHPSQDSKQKTTLVIAPVALLRQWAREIKIMTSPSLSVYIHHGTGKLTKSKSMLKYDVVLTSYSTIGYEETMRLNYEEQRYRREFRKKTASMEQTHDTHTEDEKNDKIKSPSCPLLEATWYRIILDEAHYIKNKATKSSLGCCDMNAQYRWAVTGTPMQNNLAELYTLIKFLEIKPYNNFGRFQGDIEYAIKLGGEVAIEATKKIHALLTAIMLRRTKDSQIDGQVILTLPEKHCSMDEIQLVDEERLKYVELENRIKNSYNRVSAQQGTKKQGSTGSSVLTLLLRLRQSCNHSLLADKTDGEPPATLCSHKDGLELAKSLQPAVVDRLKQLLMEGTECPICFDTLSTSTTILVPCGHYYCGECLVQALEVRHSDDENDELSMCPQCRTQFDLKKTIDIGQFRAVHCPEELDDPEDHKSALRENGDIKYEKPAYLLNFVDKGKGKSRATIAQSKLTDYKALSEWFNRLYGREIDTFVPSSKIERIMALLKDTFNHRPGEKTIVFSQFTSFLDLVQIPLAQQGLKFLRYDGSLNAMQRNETIVKFEQDPEYNIILISLKSGNVGLNLTCANHVILSEPFWNPYVEDQAIDRAHRIGQHKEVFVHRLITKDSMESRVLEVQTKKRNLIDIAMDPTQTAAITKLGRDEIAYLFGVGKLR